MTTALYRRYRPQTFAEVIGQDHVTAPLRAALRSGQVNHAYLFSGPRGCGKTSSARILARVLNCERNTPENPTDTPCGECPSCVELATGGPGSLDVVEIDAASHGGVDDARELRERATFAPARDRYKVFVIDEAHMVSNAGFNALLKIVEEPPPHVRFIFATTEPDKVIATIRSRTHHYPFRLVPPDVLVPYLEHVCEAEGVAVGSGVLPLVVRAGAGSVRDSLSVLDQLIAGSGGAGIEYEGAVALLGYTPAALLDDLVDAIAARDGATAFNVVERVIATGHEPRRFVEDLLERLRDLIVIAASGPAATAALGSMPADLLERMRAQATHLGWSELSRSADLANAALTEMVGATSPRLQLELLMARLLLPSASDDVAGLGARLDRLERGTTSPGAAASVVAAPTTGAPEEPPAPEPPSGLSYERADGKRQPVRGFAPVHEPAPEAPTAAPEPPAPAPVPIAAAEPPAPAPGAAAEPGTGVAAGAQDTEMLRRRWPEVLETVKGLRRTTWILVSQNAQVADLDATTLRLSFPTAGLVDRFRDHADVVARAVHETLGFDVRVVAVVGGATSAQPAAPGQSPAGSSAPRPARSRGIPSAEEAAASWDAPASATSAPAAPEQPVAESAPASRPKPAGSSATRFRQAAAARTEASSSATAEARPASSDPEGDDLDDAPDLPGDEPPDDEPLQDANGDAPPDDDDEPSPDDPLIEGSNLVGAPLVARLLGGTVIDEQVDPPS